MSVKVNAHANKKPFGFHLLAIDRFMRSSRAVPILALVATTSLVALLPTESGISWSCPNIRNLRARPSETLAAIVFFLVSGSYESVRGARPRLAHHVHRELSERVTTRCMKPYSLTYFLGELQ